MPWPLANIEQISRASYRVKKFSEIWEDTVQAAVAAGRSFGTLHIDWHIKADFFPLGKGVLDQKTMQRRQAVRFSAEPDRDIYYASAEDIILRKLDWYRRSQELLDRQWRDVLGIMKVQSVRLDLTYLRTMASELELADELDRCLTESGLGG